jgi:hypothetical protein
MANTIQFACAERTIDVTVTPVLGSVRAGGGHDDRGGGRIPAARAGYACNGSCQVVLTSETATGKQHTLSELLSLVSPVGDGDFTITGAGLWENIKSWNALVDVNITGDSVQVADISWKGSANPSAA